MDFYRYKRDLFNFYFIRGTFRDIILDFLRTPELRMWIVKRYYQSDSQRYKNGLKRMNVNFKADFQMDPQ